MKKAISSLVVFCLVLGIGNKRGIQLQERVFTTWMTAVIL